MMKKQTATQGLCASAEVNVLLAHRINAIAWLASEFPVIGRGVDLWLACKVMEIVHNQVEYYMKANEHVNLNKLRKMPTLSEECSLPDLAGEPFSRVWQPEQ